jgi:serine phosphatase RsbU (regulator of sigma subunit)
MRAQTWLFTFAIVGLVVATVVGFVLARADAEASVEGRAQRAADQAAVAVATAVDGALASLAGAPVLVGDDGEVDREAFDAYAGGLLAAGEVRSLALIVEVDDADRDAVEALLGVPISVLEDGALVPAPDADVHYPVVGFAAAAAGVTALGLDYGGDPIRLGGVTAAAESGGPVVTQLVRTTASGQPGLSIIQPIVDPGPGGDVVGFVSTGLQVEPLAEQVATVAGVGITTTLVDGEVVLFGPEVDERSDAQRAPVEVAGRTWHVLAQVDGGSDLALAWAIATAGAVAVVAMLGLVVVTERHQRQLGRANTMLALGSDRSRAIQDLAGRLARALSGDEVATALLAHLPAAVGAASAAIATRTGSGWLELLGHGRRPGYDDGDEAEVRAPLHTEPGSRVEQALATRVPAWLSSPLAWRDDEATAALAAGGWALALLPIEGEGVEGVLAVSYPSVHTFADDEKALLETVGVLAARALSRARRYDNEHGMAVTFQRAALPSDLPAVPGLSIAARYRPGTEWATVGGDWYDVVVVDDHRVVLVVGDVVGHGMQAAASMGRLRTAFQTIAPLEPDPGRMVEAISAQVAMIPDAFCTTVVCLVVDLEARTLTWCRAGHPPPLLIDRDGGRLLDEEGLPPLGVLPDEVAPVHRRELTGDESLILYTDGVIERRGESLDEGFRRLEVVAGDLVDLEPEELIDALLLALVPTQEQADDVVLLVVRFDLPER